MHPTLEEKYLKLEKARNLLLDMLQDLHDATFNTSVVPDKWSIAQIVAHLVLVEQVVFADMEKRLSNPRTLPPATVKTQLKSFLLKVALRSGIKFKAPRQVAHVPAHATLPALRSDWNTIRYKLKGLLTDLSPALMDKCILNHPRVGPLSPSQSLVFLQDHFDHHVSQIKQLKRIVQEKG